MNQRIAVRAIIRIDEKTLLLRRSTGRPSILGKYELPGGKLEYGEQPEDALGRYLHDDAGLVLRTAQLFDILTYIDHDDRDVQYVFILYIVSLDPASSKVQLGAGYDHYEWKKLSDIQQERLTESAKLLLGISQQRVQSGGDAAHIETDVKDATDIVRAIVYSDGGSRGNPGPSAAGFVIMNEQEHVIHEGGAYLGIATNNIAEYQGVRLGLEKALQMGVRIVDFRIDSMLVVNQMNGSYTIKNRELWPIYERIIELAKHFDKVTYTHIKREFNQLADGMVNKILNAHGQDSV
jgi:mutator protein MutT